MHLLLKYRMVKQADCSNNLKIGNDRSHLEVKQNFETVFLAVIHFPGHMKPYALWVRLWVLSTRTLAMPLAKLAVLGFSLLCESSDAWQMRPPLSVLVGDRSMWLVL